MKELFCNRQTIISISNLLQMFAVGIWFVMIAHSGSSSNYFAFAQSDLDECLENGLSTDGLELYGENSCFDLPCCQMIVYKQMHRDFLKLGHGNSLQNSPKRWMFAVDPLFWYWNSNRGFKQVDFLKHHLLPAAMAVSILMMWSSSVVLPQTNEKLQS